MSFYNPVAQGFSSHQPVPQSGAPIIPPVQHSHMLTNMIPALVNKWVNRVMQRAQSGEQLATVMLGALADNGYVNPHYQEQIQIFVDVVDYQLVAQGMQINSAIESVVDFCIDVSIGIMLQNKPHFQQYCTDNYRQKYNIAMQNRESMRMQMRQFIMQRQQMNQTQGQQFSGVISSNQQASQFAVNPNQLNGGVPNTWGQAQPQQQFGVVNQFANQQQFGNNGFNNMLGNQQQSNGTGGQYIPPVFKELAMKHMQEQNKQPQQLQSTFDINTFHNYLVNPDGTRATKEQVANINNQIQSGQAPSPFPPTPPEWFEGTVQQQVNTQPVQQANTISNNNGIDINSLFKDTVTSVNATTHSDPNMEYLNNMIQQAQAKANEQVVAYENDKPVNINTQQLMDDHINDIQNLTKEQLVAQVKESDDVLSVSQNSDFSNKPSVDDSNERSTWEIEQEAKRLRDIEQAKYLKLVSEQEKQAMHDAEEQKQREWIEDQGFEWDDPIFEEEMLPGETKQECLARLMDERATGQLVELDNGMFYYKKTNAHLPKGEKLTIDNVMLHGSPYPFSFRSVTGDWLVPFSYYSKIPIYNRGIYKKIKPVFNIYEEDGFFVCDDEGDVIGFTVRYNLEKYEEMKMNFDQHDDSRFITATSKTDMTHVPDVKASADALASLQQEVKIAQVLESLDNDGELVKEDDIRILTGKCIDIDTIVEGEYANDNYAMLSTVAVESSLETDKEYDASQVSVRYKHVHFYPMQVTKEEAKSLGKFKHKSTYEDILKVFEDVEKEDKVHPSVLSNLNKQATIYVNQVLQTQLEYGPNQIYIKSFMSDIEDLLEYLENKDRKAYNKFKMTAKKLAQSILHLFDKDDVIFTNYHGELEEEFSQFGYVRDVTVLPLHSRDISLGGTNGRGIVTDYSHPKLYEVLNRRFTSFEIRTAEVLLVTLDNRCIRVDKDVKDGHFILTEQLGVQV